jgi:ABC-type bacteriocin/lantibiotic exporter with double-glycine peptidase domain
LLGLIEPTKGDVLINEVSATTWFRENAGAISYMPQETNLVFGTILENICLGIELNEIDFDAVELAISQARLKSFIQDLPQGLDTVISAEAKNVSGGQRQRIGLARALYSKPSLLILDEATSAIDGAIEDEILQVIHSLPRETIVVFVAHRLSAIRDFPRILYVKAGELSSDGDLKTIMDDVPEFEKQIRRFIL